MQKIPVVRRIPVPVHKKPEQSYTHRVQIGMPATMTTTSVSEEHGNNHTSSEENVNYVDGKTQEKIAKYGGFQYRDFLPQDFSVADWIHEGAHKVADQVNQ